MSHFKQFVVVMNSRWNVKPHIYLLSSSYVILYAIYSRGCIADTHCETDSSVTALSWLHSISDLR